MESRVDISKRLVAINAASTLMLRVLNVSVLLWMYQYLLKRIEPDDFALYPVLMAVMAVTPVIRGTLVGGLARFTVDAYAKGEETRVTQIVSSLVPILAVASILFLAVGLCFSWYVGVLLNILPRLVSDARIMMVLLVVGFTVQFFLIPFVLGFQILQRFVLLNLTRLLEEITKIALLTSLLIGVSPRVLWVVVANVTAQLIFVIVRVVISRRLVPLLRFRSGLFDGSTAREMISFGKWMALGNISRIIQNMAPPIILNKLGTASDVTSFHLGSLVNRQIRNLAAMGLMPAQPALTAMYSTGQEERLGNVYFQGGRYFMWATLFVAFPLLAFPTEILYLYIGPNFPKYADSPAVLVVLVGVFPIIYSSILLDRVCIATARIQAFFLTALMTQIVIVGLMSYFVGVNDRGSVGAALAISTGSAAAHLLIYWPLALRLLHLGFADFWRKTLRPGVLPFLAGLAVCTGIGFFARPETWTTVLLFSGAGGVVYLAVLALCLEAGDRADLERFKSSLRRRRVEPSPQDD